MADRTDIYEGSQDKWRVSESIISYASNVGPTLFAYQLVEINFQFVSGNAQSGGNFVRFPHAC